MSPRTLSTGLSWAQARLSAIAQVPSQGPKGLARRPLFCRACGARGQSRRQVHAEADYSRGAGQGPSNCALVNLGCGQRPNAFAEELSRSFFVGSGWLVGCSGLRRRRSLVGRVSRMDQRK